MEENEDEIKLKFIKLDKDCMPVNDENGKNIIVEDISDIDYAALILPEGYMALVLEGMNTIKNYNENSKEKKNEYLDYSIGRAIVDYTEDQKLKKTYWSAFKRKNVGITILFKKPKNIRIKEGIFLTVGGFKTSYIDATNPVIVKCGNCKNCVAVNREDEIVENYEEIFMDRLKETISESIKLPLFCYPLYNCTDNMSFSGENKNVEKNKVKKMLNYITFEYPNEYKHKIEKGDETAWVNGVCYDGLEFMNKVFLSNCLTDDDYWKLLNNITKYGGTSLDLVSFEDIKEENIEYLWYPYIPLGSIVLLAGDPGVGKSFIALKLASIISKGDTFPFDVNYKSIPLHPSNVILQNAEDGKGTTIKSRLKKLGADMSKIWFIDESTTQFKLNNLDILERALYEKKPKLVVIDPITQYLPRISMDRANEVRNALAPLAELASRYKCTFFLIAHKNKNTKTDGIYRVIGSIDFVGICRSMLTASIVDGVTYLKQEKNSTAEFGKPIEYCIDENGLEFVRQVDNKEIDVSVDKAIEEAKKFILKELKDGEIPSKDIYSDAYSEGIAKATLDRAKKDLGVGSRKRKDDNGTEYWVWVSKQDKDNNMEITAKSNLLT